MAGHASKERSEETEDHHRAHNLSRESYSPAAGPRTSPTLHAEGNFMSIEPRSVSASTLINHDDNDDTYEYDSDNYTFSSSRDTWHTYSTHDGENVGGLRSPNIQDAPRGLGIDHRSTESRETPRTNTEVLKASSTSAIQTATHPAGNKSSKKSTQESAKPRGAGSPRALQDVAEKAVKTTKGKSTTGTDRAEAGSTRYAPSTNGGDIARGFGALTIQDEAPRSLVIEPGSMEDKEAPKSTAKSYAEVLKASGASLQSERTKVYRPVPRGPAPGIPRPNHKPATNRNHTYPTPATGPYQYADNSAEEYAARSATRRYTEPPFEEPDSFYPGSTLPTSWLQDTKGLGDWAKIPPINNLQILTTGPLGKSTRNLSSIAGVVQCKPGNSSSEPQKGSAQSTQSQAGQQAGPGKERNRRHGSKGDRPGNANGDGADDDDIEESGGDPGKSPSDPLLSPGNKAGFACPFHKRDPQYYCDNVLHEPRSRYRACATVWRDLGRLKEHLYRVHKSISRDVIERLKKRPKRKKTEIERWYEIWGWIFPDEAPPYSPYFGSQGHAEVPEINAYEVDGDPSDTDEPDAFHTFLDKRMPGHFVAKFRAELDMLNLDKEMKVKLINIASRLHAICRQELLDTYEVNQTFGHNYVSPDTGDDFDHTSMMSIAHQDFSSPLVQNPNAMIPETGALAIGMTASYTALNNFPYSPTSIHPQVPSFSGHLTPVSSQKLRRPVTPKYRSISSMSADSAYQSGRGSGPRSVDSASNNRYQATPTPQAQMSQSRVCATLGPSTNATWSYDDSNAISPGQGRTGTYERSSVMPNIDTPMYDELSDTDAHADLDDY